MCTTSVLIGWEERKDESYWHHVPSRYSGNQNWSGYTERCFCGFDAKLCVGSERYGGYTHGDQLYDQVAKMTYSCLATFFTTFMQIISKNFLQLDIRFLALVLSFCAIFASIESYLCKVWPPYYYHGITFKNLWYENAESRYEAIVSIVQ